MATLEDIHQGTFIRGVEHGVLVEAVSVRRIGSDAIDLAYRIPGSGHVRTRLLSRSDEFGLEVTERMHTWSFDGDGDLFRLVSEARRIRLAHLFDAMLAVHTSEVEPLPHQITAVYHSMLKRQPLRFLLADDPGAGKTIMAGLLIRELIARGDLKRCLIVCPGNLTEQWHDEMYQKFYLKFDIMTNDKVATARTTNWFVETPMVIARLDKLARNTDMQALLEAPDCSWDVIICDEAHKMSASFFGGEVKYTKRYQLGRLLSSRTRHFLLLTATPHNGKEADFQLFMALLDADRFEGKFRDGIHRVEVSDIMRRMVKEDLYKFDKTPLFPERIAHSVRYKLSEGEAMLYREVSDYVRNEFNRAKALSNKRARNVGFALTILQRRLASSPEAIYQSLCRRAERLGANLQEIRQQQRQYRKTSLSDDESQYLDEEDIDDLEDLPDDEFSDVEEKVLDRATAAQTVEELEAEISSLERLISLAEEVRRNGEDRKWQELVKLLDELFDPLSKALPKSVVPSPRQKLVIFTEHRDTLTYLYRRITTHLGRPESVVVIHGGTPTTIGRTAESASSSADTDVQSGNTKYRTRRAIQEAFMNDPQVKILLANDAASEGINLQRAHLMVNYDLPWNPNRIEQRFGRIHRIGQKDVCNLWNLIAEDTREGEIYHVLFAKLEEARKALGGKVFDVLGKLMFDGKPLRDLLIDAIVYGGRPDVQNRLTQAVSDAFDQRHVQSLLTTSLVPDVMDARRIHEIREEMERAEARRLQPHYIKSFFMAAFGHLRGRVRKREPQRFYVSHVPESIRNQSMIPGSIPLKYERITFEKSIVSQPGHADAEFVRPGHPLLDATTSLMLERHEKVLRQGAILVDTADYSDKPRILVYLEHGVVDGSVTRSGEPRVISQRILYVSVYEESITSGHSYAPYLDYRARAGTEPTVEDILSRPECGWINSDLETRAMEHAVSNLVSGHLEEVRSQRLDLLARTESAVKDRLTKEIAHWDRRAEDLKLQEQAGKTNARLNSTEAQRKADELSDRLEKRLERIERERHISSLAPVVISGALVIPIGLLNKMEGKPVDVTNWDTQAAAARARNAVMDVERNLGYEPVDVENEKIGYDIESRVSGIGKLRFIEVKGRIQGASTVTVTTNEILTSLNKPEDYILAIVEFQNDGGTRVRYVRKPFGKEPDFGVESVNYNLSKLLERSEEPS